MYSPDQEDAAFLWYDLDQNRFTVNITADLYPGIVNYDGSLITLETSYEKNPIYSIASQEIVYIQYYPCPPEGIWLFCMDS